MAKRSRLFWPKVPASSGQKPASLGQSRLQKGNAASGKRSEAKRSGASYASLRFASLRYASLPKATRKLQRYSTLGSLGSQGSQGRVFPSIPVYSRVFPCIPGNTLYSRYSRVSPVFPCVPVYTRYSRVFPCIPGVPVYSRVFPCVPVFPCTEQHARPLSPEARSCAARGDERRGAQPVRPGWWWWGTPLVQYPTPPWGGGVLYHGGYTTTPTPDGQAGHHAAQHRGPRRNGPLGSIGLAASGWHGSRGPWPRDVPVSSVVLARYPEALKGPLGQSLDRIQGPGGPGPPGCQ